jgi:hypothetical protein
LLFDDDDLYVGGDFGFYISGEGSISNLGKYDTVNRTWTNRGIPNGSHYTIVRALAFAGGDLYAAGIFNGGYGLSEGDNITRWGGYGWEYVGPSPQNEGVNDTVWALAVVSDKLYVGGEFTQAASIDTPHLAIWDTSAPIWATLNSGTNGILRAVAMSGNNVYVGGDFTTVGGVSANHIARWDGSRWNPLGSGVNSVVYALTLSGDYLYVGGKFTGAGPHTPAAHNARYYTRTGQWSILGSGLNDAVRAIVVDGTNIYAGGDFTTAGGVAASHVAKWNGSQWSALGTSLVNGVGDDVYALAMSGDYLYVGGLFTGTGPHAPAARIARYYTTTGQWSALGSGLNDDVFAIAVIGTNVYAGGDFTTAGGVSANHIARWNGTSWSPLGVGMGGPVYALAANGNNLYAGGWFAGSIGKWNGSQWSTLGSGTDLLLHAVAVSASTGNVSVGGAFYNAGGKSSRFVGLYHDTP